MPTGERIPIKDYRRAREELEKTGFIFRGFANPNIDGSTGENTGWFWVKGEYSHAAYMLNGEYVELGGSDEGKFPGYHDTIRRIIERVNSASKQD